MLPGAQRMVVGHTIQGAGINTACNDRVFRIDVGLSRGCGDGEPEVSAILLQLAFNTVVIGVIHMLIQFKAVYRHPVLWLHSQLHSQPCL